MSQSVFVLVAAIVCSAFSSLSAAEPQRWALLIGVDDYVGFNDLSFCGNDAAALAEALKESGFESRRIVLLHDGAKENRFRPFKANIEQQLDNLLKLAGPDDLVIVSFSGHGVHLDGKSYLCPNEANDARPAETLIAVDDVYARFNRCEAALKLLVVDACRNDPRPPGKRSATPEADLRKLGVSFDRPPDGIVVLSSCAPGQVSWEETELKHGVFMHHVLKGLKGEADGNHNGRVTLGELYDYAGTETKLFVLDRFNEVQIPALRGEINGVFELPRTGPPKTMTNSIGMQLTLLPAGDFLMGSSDDDAVGFDDERPRHSVRIDKPFYCGTHEVTRGQFAQFVEAEGYLTSAERDGQGGWSPDKSGTWKQLPEQTWRAPGITQDDDHPVVTITWDDAVAFCGWLSRKEGRVYRLPTEIEWEYAYRGDTTTLYYFGDDSTQLTSAGNVGDDACRAHYTSWTEGPAGNDGFAQTAPVGRFKPNPFGLHDMAGNVWEWCHDWYDEQHYQTKTPEQTTGPATGTQRVIRSGSWIDHDSAFRSADRNADDPANRTCTLGFRVVALP